MNDLQKMQVAFVCLKPGKHPGTNNPFVSNPQLDKPSRISAEFKSEGRKLKIEEIIHHNYSLNPAVTDSFLNTRNESYPAGQKSVKIKIIPGYIA